MFRKRPYKYKPGDYLMQDDLTGEIIRRSEAVKLWNNQFTRKKHYEARNPQDFLRARPEREPFKEVRPRTIEYIDRDNPITPDDL